MRGSGSEMKSVASLWTYQGFQVRVLKFIATLTEHVSISTTMLEAHDHRRLTMARSSLAQTGSNKARESSINTGIAYSPIDPDVISAVSAKTFS